MCVCGRGEIPPCTKVTASLSASVSDSTDLGLEIKLQLFSESCFVKNKSFMLYLSEYYTFMCIESHGEYVQTLVIWPDI